MRAKINFIKLRTNFLQVRIDYIIFEKFTGIMKTYILFVAMLLGAGSLLAQEKRYNQFSFQLSGGIEVPVTGRNMPSRKKNIQLPQLQAGIRYMFNPKFGLLGTYGYNRFKMKSANPDFRAGIEYHRATLEAVANLGQIFKIDYRIRENAAVLAHAGAGLSLVDYAGANRMTKYGNLTAGFTGEIKASERIAVFGDVSYIANLREIDLNYPVEIKGYANVSIGIIYNFGYYKYHADWY